MGGARVKSINLVTVGIPKILQGIIVDRLDKHIGIELVDHFVSIKDFDDECDDREPHVVIVDSLEEFDCKNILYKYPRARVVSLRHMGKSCALWKLRPYAEELGEISPEQLIEIISQKQFRDL